MKHYFYSPVECSLVFGGSFLGTVSRNVSFVEGEKSDVFTFTREGFCPSLASIGGVRYNADVYDFFDGALYVPRFVRPPESYKLLQKKSVVVSGGEFVVTLYVDGTTKADIKCVLGELTVSVPIKATGFEIVNCGNSVLVEFKEKAKHIVLVSLEKFGVILEKTCVDYLIGSVLTVKRTVLGGHYYTLTEHYRVTDKAELYGSTLTPLKKINTSDELLLSLAFLDAVKFGGGIKRFLSPALNEKADDVCSFFGNFSFALPPVCPSDPTAFSLVYKDSVKYVRFAFENGLISDVDLTDEALYDDESELFAQI